MKWDKLRFVGAANVDLPIIGADPSGPFILKGVEGLDPPPVDVIFSKARGQRGVRQNREPQFRQIVALVGLQPNWDEGQSPEALRTELYGLLTPKYDQPVKARIMLGSTVLAEAQGDISNIEASIFTKDPEVQVTLDCDYGYLLATAPVTQLPGRTVSGGQTLLAVANSGTAPAGFLLEFTLQQAIAGALNIGENDSQGRVMSIAGPHAAGDTFIIDTRPGKLKVNKIPAGGGTETSILNKLSGTSPWLTLHGGANQLFINATLFDWYQAGFTHTPAYWGV